MPTVNDTWIGEITDNTIISDIDNAIRQTRQACHERLAKEHVTYEDDSSSGSASSDGYHLSGSAKAWAQSAAPTNRPDGTTLNSADKGRIWIQEDGDNIELKYYGSDGFASLNRFSNRVSFPNGISVGGVTIDDSEGDFEGFLGINDDNLLMGVTGDLELANGNGIIPTSTGNSHLGTEDNSFGSVYGDAVHGAVGNDIADSIDGVVDKICFGACYVIGPKGIVFSSKRAQQGTVGVCTNTASLVAGNKTVSGNKIPIAIGGFPLARVDRVYPVGTALVSGPDGALTRAPWWVRLLFPERIVGVYFREPGPFWGDIPMNGRAIIKVM